MKPRILVTRRWPAAVERELQAAFDVQLNETDVPLTPAQLHVAMTEYDALCPTVSDRLPRTVLDAAPRRVRLIASYGVGFDHVDVDAAAELGIPVTNTPDVLTDCTADLTMTLVLAVARRAVEGDAELRAGAWTGWRPTHLLGTRVSGKVLGLIGYGRIARAVARRAALGFGMTVCYHDPGAARRGHEDDARATPCATLDELLERADFVSLHCPSTPATRHLLNARRLARMRPGTFLVNTARGDVVDTEALVQALRSGHLGGAGLDVYEGEPHVASTLLPLPNVVLLPHLGSATVETRVAMGRRVLANLDAFFSGRSPPDRVRGSA